jgi:hypothetical protein
MLFLTLSVYFLTFLYEVRINITYEESITHFISSPLCRILIQNVQNNYYYTNNNRDGLQLLFV